MQGRIIVNANNSADVWSGALTVAALPVSYDASTFPLSAPEVFGGGSIGVAPFDLYDNSCFPARGAVIPLPVMEALATPLNPFTPEPDDQFTAPFDAPVLYRHLGPIVALTPQQMPVMIERRRVDPILGDWQDLTEFFTATIPVAGMNEHATYLAIRPIGFAAFFSAFEYRLTPIETELRCRDVAGTPAASVYSVIVENPCPWDITGDGLVNSSDLAALLAGWGACVLPNPCYGDYTGDGQVNSSDLAQLLASWNNCEGGAALGGGGASGGGMMAAAQSGGGGEPEVPDIVSGLGFDTIDEYIEWLDSLSEQELAEHLLDLLDAIGG